MAEAQVIEIDPQQATPGFAALFDQDAPARIRCLAVLAGVAPGTILADDLERPTWGIAWEAFEGTLYAGTALDSACESAGEHTYYNCAATNVASAAVARKLGYRTEREYRLVAWFKSAA